ncbi:MAG: carbohydrate-binding domain-containing protein [Paludibacteraceae bacterium]|nr:carbohydrate-binding domain-containing protein [Paludibacteraceae bacterium]
MKSIKTLFCTLLVVCNIALNAQTLNVQTGSVTYQFPASTAGEMVYDNATTLTIQGKTFALTDIDRMYVDNSVVTDNLVSVNYSGTTASVLVAGNVAQYLTITVDGAHVSALQSELVGDATGKITYSLEGTTTNGGFYHEGTYKIDLVLNGVTITNPTGPAINIQNGKKINFTLKAGSTNTLTDGAGGDWKGCVRIKGHTEMKGQGTLNITGKTANAFWGKEFLELKNCTLNILSAVGDGINVNQHFTMESGALNISGVGDDGVQVSYETDDYGTIIEEADNTGAATISGGTIDITCTAAGTKGLKAEGPISISEFGTVPNITIKTTGGTIVETVNSVKDTSVCVALKSETSINISGGVLTLTSTGQGGRAMTCDQTITISGGTTTASAEGSNYGSSSGGWWKPQAGPGGGGPGGGGSSSNGKNAKGVKAKGAITITGGNLNVYSANHEGMESKSAITISGGNVYVKAGDDAINAAGDFTISGGVVYGYSTSNDGLDSNGNFYIKGGVAIGFGAGGAESGIDTGEGRYLYVTGGYAFGIGGRVDATIGSSSTQAYITGGSSMGGGGWGGGGSSSQSLSGGYAIISQGNTRLFAVKLPTTSYSGSVFCTAPSMTKNTSYTVGSASSVTGTEENGFIESPTVSTVSNTKSYTAK